MIHEELTRTIIQAFFRVYNSLGFGFLEKVYENALAHELRDAGLHAQQQCLIKVLYKGQLVGNYYADILVERKVLLEIKTAEALVTEHEAQLVNYLKATGIEVGLLLNFGPRATFERKIYTPYTNRPNPRKSVSSAEIRG
jgi:GxxExxY protein